jgi:hypothetical protein
MVAHYSEFALREKGGFDFLGYHFERGHRWPRPKSLDQFRETIRQKTGGLRPGSRKATAGQVGWERRGDSILNLMVGWTCKAFACKKSRVP